jgi:hypothetical protein
VSTERLQRVYSVHGGMQGGTRSSEERITDEPHPFPSLREMQRETLQYKRADGVALNAELFTPPGYDKDKDGPLPCLLWAYPRCSLALHIYRSQSGNLWLSCPGIRLDNPGMVGEMTRNVHI